MISSAHDLLVFFDHLFGEEDLLSPEALAQDLTFVVWFNASSLLPGEDNISVTINSQRDRLRDLALGLAE